jgi:hypothetical protein
MFLENGFLLFDVVVVEPNFYRCFACVNHPVTPASL